VLSRRRPLALQGQVANLSFPLAFEAAFDNQEQIVNGATDAQGARHLEQPGIPSPAAIRSYACFVKVDTSCETTTRPCWAAHSRSAGSVAPESPTSWARTMSTSSFRRISPRTMLLLKFSSAASRTTGWRG